MAYFVRTKIKNTFRFVEIQDNEDLSMTEFVERGKIFISLDRFEECLILYVQHFTLSFSCA